MLDQNFHTTNSIYQRLAKIAQAFFFLLSLLFAFASYSQEKSEAYTISFEKNKFALSTQNKSLLSLLVDTLKRKTNYKIYINGHADSDADSSYNTVLSLKRSLAVKTFFTQNGISDELIITRALGEEQPLVENLTAFSKAKNRRVEIFILYEEEPAEVAADLLEVTEKPQPGGCNEDTLVELRDGYRVELSKCDWEKNKECLQIQKRLTYKFRIKENWLKKHIGFKNYRKYISYEPRYEFSVVSCYDSCFAKSAKLFVPQQQAADLDIKRAYSQKRNSKGGRGSLRFKKAKLAELAYYVATIYCPGAIDCGFDNRCTHLVKLKTQKDISILAYSYNARKVLIPYIDSLVYARPVKTTLLIDNYQHTFFNTLTLFHQSDTITVNNLPIDILAHGSGKIKTKGTLSDKKYIVFIPFRKKYKCGHYKKYKIRKKDLEGLKSYVFPEFYE
ncbi:MAG TPA: OmpA family protein [Chitinophagaceae bacterium]